MDGPVHTWFELTYSSYLVLPRSVLQAAPDEWQQRFVRCLEELREMFAHEDLPATYCVQIRDDRGRFVKDELANYRRPTRELVARPGGLEPPSTG